MATMRIWAPLALTFAVVGCGSSSGGSCPADVGTPNTPITVVGDDGTPICDAYITGTSVDVAFCEWSGCTCIHRPSFGEPFSDKPDTLSVTLSRRGYETNSVTMTFPAVSCNGGPERQWKITMKATAAASGCVARDALFCSDHRTCYDGATAPGCTATGETSTDPGASYVCCKLGF